MKTLQEALLEEGVPFELVDKVEELSRIEFERSLIATIREYYLDIQRTQYMYDISKDLERDCQVKYYQLPGGGVGYIVIGKRSPGFNLPR